MGKEPLKRGDQDRGSEPGVGLLSENFVDRNGIRQVDLLVLPQFVGGIDGQRIWVKSRRGVYERKQKAQYGRQEFYILSDRENADITVAWSRLPNTFAQKILTVLQRREDDVDRRSRNSY